MLHFLWKHVLAGCLLVLPICLYWIWLTRKGQASLIHRVGGIVLCMEFSAVLALTQVPAIGQMAWPVDWNIQLWPVDLGQSFAVSVMFLLLGLTLPLFWRHMRRGWKVLALCIVTMLAIGIFRLLGNLDVYLGNGLLYLCCTGLGYSLYWGCLEPVFPGLAEQCQRVRHDGKAPLINYLFRREVRTFFMLAWIGRLCLGQWTNSWF